MNDAKKMLESTRMKIMDISGKIGKPALSVAKISHNNFVSLTWRCILCMANKRLPTMAASAQAANS
jgi:hypothetical protein